MGAAVLNLVLFGLFTVLEPPTGILRQNKYITLDIRILVIPAFQSKMVGGKSKEGGGVSGGLFMGNVTTNFPEGIVVLEAPSCPENKGLVRLIKERVSSYPCSCAGFLQIIPFKTLNVILDSNTSGYAVYEIHEQIPGRGEYWMYFSIDTDQQEILLNFLCEAIFYDDLIFNEKARVLRKELFNRTITLNSDQTLLIGFAPPRGKNGIRGSAYWFVIRK